MTLRVFKNGFIALVLSTVAVSCTNSDLKSVKDNDTNSSIVKYANNFIGTGDQGHTYPGAQVPFGMVQLSPDNGQSGWEWVSGYHYSDSIIVGLAILTLVVLVSVICKIYQ